MQVKRAARSAQVGTGRVLRSSSMKLTIVGGGGFRVPLVYGALLATPRRARVRRDRPPRRRRRARSSACSGVLRRASPPSAAATLPFRVTTDLGDAVEGADFVFCAIRVGRLEGRVVDESVPLGLGVLGQETTGPGGICFALRTIPAMVELAETIAERAPRAWLINFTNPAGMVTEARPPGARRPRDRHLRLAVGASAGASPARSATRPTRCGSTTSASTTSAGCRRPRTPSGDRLPELLADDAALAGFEEGRLFGGDWLRTLGMIPNEYLYYFYFGADTVRRSGERGQPRGAYLLESQAAFYAQNGQDPADGARAPGAPPATSATAPTWPRRAAPPASTHEHDDGGDGGGYEGEAMAVVEAIANNTRAIMILNTANRSALPFLDEHAVVEVPCDRRPQRPGAGRDRARRRRTRRRSSRRSRTSSARRSRRR